MRKRIYLLVVSLSLTLLSFTPASFALPAEEALPLIDAEYFPVVHDALAGAKKSILCAMYVAQLSPRHPMGWESMLLRDIISATKRGLEVKVVLEDDPERENKYAYEFLKGAGVPVYYDSADRVTHTKMIIIDDYISILGSPNWSYSGLRLNHEAAVLIKSKEVATAFRKAFEAIEVKK
ncbi:MAG TPA: phospholipase D-like domain-containing protein [Candidatus Hypogeohydataceae bacterium YC38]